MKFESLILIFPIKKKVQNNQYNTTPNTYGVELQADQIQTDNALIISISVIIFRIRIVSDTDTDWIFNGYRIQIEYRTDTYTNMNIFQILS
jgi:hypothetical protein